MSVVGMEMDPFHKTNDPHSIMAASPSQEKTPPSAPILGEAPDGGTRAWLVAAGGFAVCSCCLGF
jgi:hypothetical protein